MRFLIFLLLFLFLCCAESEEISKNKDKSANKSLNISELILEKIEPYRTVYKNVSIKKHGNEIKVVCSIEESPYKDIYLFTVKNGSLLLKNYILEAIPEEYRRKAIEIALSSEEVIEFLSNNMISSEPTVRRILPETSQKYAYYATLFSVTWIDEEKNAAISALVDLEREEVVKVWKLKKD